MYHHILVPVAFQGQEDDGGPALNTARALAAPGARITLLHVMEELPHHIVNYLPNDYRNDLRAGILTALEDKAATVPGALPALTEGKAAPAILDWAGEHGVDCIVIASHRPGLQDWLLGSTAARVVRHARCAVHVMR